MTKKVSLFNRQVFIKDIVIAILIVAMPFLFFLYEMIPVSSTWKTWFFELKINHFIDANYFMWVFLGKTMMIIFASIWLITCKHWWRFFISFPIIMEIFRVVGLINEEFLFFGKINVMSIFLISLFLSTFYIFFLYYLSKKLNFTSLTKSLSGKIDSELDKQLKKLSNFSVSNYKSANKELLRLQMKRKYYSNDQYLEQLLNIRQRIMNIDENEENKN